MKRAIAECTCRICGKSFEKVAFKRNCEEANGWKAWAEKNCDICPDCYRAEMAADNAQRAQESGLPQLTGSAKQIAWAEKIRLDFWSAYLDHEKRMEEAARRIGQLEEFEGQRAIYRGVFQRITSAEEYINARGARIASFIINHLTAEEKAATEEYKQRCMDAAQKMKEEEK